MITILVLSVFAITIFLFMNRSNKNRRQNNRLRHQGRQDELLSILREKQNSNPTNERSDATEAP
jgi:hypothetical protein